jgi:hypothetical protein
MQSNNEKEIKMKSHITIYILIILKILKNALFEKSFIRIFLYQNLKTKPLAQLHL